MSYGKLKYFVWWLNYFYWTTCDLKVSKLMNAQKLIQKFHDKYFQKSQTNASRKKRRHTATKPKAKERKKENSNFYIFFRFFFHERVFTDFNKTKMTWKKWKLWIQKKKSYWLITNYRLFDVLSFFFVSRVRNTIAKSQFYSKTYIDFSHKNNKSFFHKKTHFQFAPTAYFVRSKKNSCISFLFRFENASMAF